MILHYRKLNFVKISGSYWCYTPRCLSGKRSRSHIHYSKVTELGSFRPFATALDLNEKICLIISVNYEKKKLSAYSFTLRLLIREVSVSYYNQNLSL